ncbi:KpsF [Rodentibacter pneumotropicus]|uniref:KpsF n=1 Tax=Rodentibacter pneumotropicus TaxID=758 RepID=A0A3S4VEH5_9PAST|nr:KpsF [Rodentibacter pneumotropicus]
MNYLQIARDTLSVESLALTQLSQRLDENFNQIVELILACQGRLVIGGIGKSGLIGKKWSPLLPLPARQVSFYIPQRHSMVIWVCSNPLILSC